MPEHMRLLNQAMQLDAKLGTEQTAKFAKLLSKVGVAPTPVFQPMPERLFDDLSEADDPFGGNINNRKVAERIAKQGEIITGSKKNPVPEVLPAVAAAEAVAVAKNGKAPSMKEPPADPDTSLGDATGNAAAPVWKPNA